MSEEIKGLEPAAVWKYFEELSQIPRESGNEAAFKDYLLDFAKSRGLSADFDPAGNVVIRKPASPGNELVPAVVLQGHMDMVCVKTPSSTHDFTRDPIRLIRKGAWMHADATTLGADNGIAVAMAMALLADPDAVHGPIEALFTTSEETGLTGAFNLDTSMVSARRLINLDSEEEGVFIIGCAGGSEVIGRLTSESAPVPADSKGWNIRLSGFLGGHSGGEIHTGRGNAIRYGMRFLRELSSDPHMQLMIADIDSGSKRNVIPSTFTCTFAAAPGKEDAVLQAAERLTAALKSELAVKDPDAAAVLTRQAMPLEAVTAAQSKAVIDAVYVTPCGPETWSSDIEGMVETSSNLAVIKLEKGEFFIDTSQRSSIESAREEIAERTRTALELSGARTEIVNVYPSWTPDFSSPFARLCAGSYRSFTGNEPEVTAIHAGLECGVINSKVAGMDSISFGPDIKGAHSVEERLNIESTARVYNFLVQLLKDLCAPES